MKTNWAGLLILFIFVSGRISIEKQLGRARERDEVM